jgi:DNA polymerase I
MLWLVRKLESQPFQTDLLLNVHDEYQTECAPEHAETVGKILVAGMEQAGRVLNVKLPITGEYKIGQSWAETH